MALLLLALAACGLLAAPSAAALVATAAAADDGQWSLVFADTFSAPSINTSAWTVRDNMTHGDKEWELYTKDNVYLEDGNLVLRTQATQARYGSKVYNFTSGWVDTRGLVELTYGKVEARIDLEGVHEGTELFGVLGDDGLGDTVGVRHEAEGLKLFRFDLDQGFVGRLASVKELVGELLVEGTRNETADNEDRHHGEDEQDKDVWCDDLSGNRAGDQLHDQVVDAAGEVADACEALGGRPRQGKHVAF